MCIFLLLKQTSALVNNTYAYTRKHRGRPDSPSGKPIHDLPYIFIMVMLTLDNLNTGK